MFNIIISEYIKSHKEHSGLTYDVIGSKAEVPLSTLHAYANGTIKNPKDDILIRIAAVFGDGPDVIRAMRLKASESTSKEQEIMKESGNEASMQKFAAVIRESVSQLLEEYRLQSAAQQTEVIEHADKRVESERQKFNDRVNEVIRQYDKEIERIKDACEKEIETTKKFCEEKNTLTEDHYKERIADLKDHIKQLLNREDKHGSEMRDKNDRSSKYLRSCVRNLSGISILLGFASLVSIIYGVYAYNTFDIYDPTQGLARDQYSIGPAMLVVFFAIILVVAYRGVLIWIRHPSKKSENTEEPVENQK